MESNFVSEKSNFTVFQLAVQKKQKADCSRVCPLASKAFDTAPLNA